MQFCFYCLKNTQILIKYVTLKLRLAAALDSNNHKWVFSDVCKVKFVCSLAPGLVFL